MPVKQETVLIAAAALVAYGTWLLVQDTEPTDSEDSDILGTAQEAAAETIDTITGGFMKISEMARVTPADLQNRNVQAMLRVIRQGEGTADKDGYRRIFGGQLFESYADHPRVTVKKSGYTSSAAGAYQILSSTWDETKSIMQLRDFSPASQDLAAVGRIAARRALDDVKAGRFDAALRKLGKEWASLPYSPYGQPTISIDRARTMYAQAGGSEAVA